MKSRAWTSPNTAKKVTSSNGSRSATIWERSSLRRFKNLLLTRDSVPTGFVFVNAIPREGEAPAEPDRDRYRV